MTVNEDNKYIAVIMRHDLDRGAYSYSLVGEAKTMAAATSLARKAKDVEYKDVIAVLEYEGISDIGKHAKKISVVDKKLNRLQILQVKTKHDQSNNVSPEGLANSWIEMYEKISFTNLLYLTSKYVDRKFTALILCEFMILVLDEMKNNALLPARSMIINMISFCKGNSEYSSGKLHNIVYTFNREMRSSFYSYNVDLLLKSLMNTADYVCGYASPDHPDDIGSNIFSASNYDFAMIDHLRDRFVSLMPLEDFLLILAKSERPKGN